jgi:hypothetical protein
MIYMSDLGDGKRVYTENTGAQTVVAIIVNESGKPESLRRTFETGPWRVPPILLRTATDLILQIASDRAHIFLRLQDNDIGVLRIPPLLIGAEILPLQQVAAQAEADFKANG